MPYCTEANYAHDFTTACGWNSLGQDLVGTGMSKSYREPGDQRIVATNLAFFQIRMSPKG